MKTKRCLCGHQAGITDGHAHHCNTDEAFIQRGQDVPQDRFTKPENKKP